MQGVARVISPETLARDEKRKRYRRSPGFD
jgi:hypothetical protein